MVLTDWTDGFDRTIGKTAGTSGAGLQVNNHHADHLNQTVGADFEIKTSKYNLIVKEAAKLIVDYCKRSTTEPTCAMKNLYLELANKLKTSKKNTKNNQKQIKTTQNNQKKIK